MGVSGKLSHEEAARNQELPAEQEARKVSREEVEEIIRKWGWILGGEVVAQMRARYTC